MWTQRGVAVPVLALLALLLTVSTVTADDDDIKLKGFADVPGGSLTLPLPAGAAAVTINVTFGLPSLTIPVQITTATKIKSEVGLPVSLVDGDAVKVKVVVVGNLLRASRLEVEAFPELELTGTVKGLPAGGLSLPIPQGTTSDLTVSLGASAVDVTVRVTPSTKLHHAPPTLHNGDVIRVEAVVRGGVVVATEIKAGKGDDDDD